jgi:hypothetical protein
VNARHTKNLPGRKSDVQESQWLLKLHTYGLLNNSFHPASAIRTLRTYWRQRATHVEGAATCILRMQKALTQMNLQLANVISITHFYDRPPAQAGNLAASIAEEARNCPFMPQADSGWPILKRTGRIWMPRPRVATSRIAGENGGHGNGLCANDLF